MWHGRERESYGVGYVSAPHGERFGPGNQDASLLGERHELIATPGLGERQPHVDTSGVCSHLVFRPEDLFREIVTHLKFVELTL